MLARILLVVPVCLGSTVNDWRSDPLGWSRAHWKKCSDIINSGESLVPYARELFHEDATYEAPVGMGVKIGPEAAADTAKIGKVHHISYYVHNAIRSAESDTLAMYNSISLHVDNCHTTINSITITKWRGDKISDSRSYWDPSNLCGFNAPWNKGPGVELFMKGYWKDVDDAINAGGGAEFARVLQKYMHDDATMENPVGTPAKKGIAEISDLSFLGKVHHISHNFVDVIKPAEPNTVAVYAISTMHFGTCRATIPSFAVFTFKGGKVTSQKNWFDTKLLTNCGAKKEL